MAKTKKQETKPQTNKSKAESKPKQSSTKKEEAKPKQSSKLPQQVSAEFLDWLSSWEEKPVAKKDVAKCEAAVLKNVPKEWRQERRQFEAFVSLAYDSGVNIFWPPTNAIGRVVRTKYTPSKDRGAALAIELSTRRVGLTRPRVVQRRRAQRQLYNKGQYIHNGHG